MQQQQHETKSNATKTTTTTTPTSITAITAINANATALPLSSSSALPNAIVQDELPQHWPALHEAAATGNEALLSNLLSGGILRTAKEPKHGNTALHEAAWRGYSRCVKLLCTPPPPPPANVESGSNKKFSCVLRKRKKQTPDIQRASAVHSILIGLQNHAGFTALHLASQQGHNQCCRELLMAGADPDVQNKYGDTALHTACRYGHAGASRILLSAACDANRVNLNGDTPLHISCAMRRRKLTRILLTEGDCDMTIKNAQNETPIDIVIRKSYVEIFDILNNQQRLRQQRKQRHKTDNKKPTIAQDATDTINWSPYGCHYFPDPRAFPAPKLETLPKEPLAQGEQYYSDLNGCIRKGPIGVGSTCYCAPFFRHIEHKINCNRRSLRRYVHNAKATIGHEVKALAERTNQQIEQLTRDMLCDRVRCESRRRHIDYWLQMAAATQQQQQQQTDNTKRKPNKMNNAGEEEEEDVDGELQPQRFSLSRCQSLDALSENKSIFMQLTNLRANNAQSCNLLDDLGTSNNIRQHLAATPTDLDSLDKQSNMEQLSDGGQTQTSVNTNRNEQIINIAQKTCSEIVEKDKDTLPKEEEEDIIKDEVDQTYIAYEEEEDVDEVASASYKENHKYAKKLLDTPNQITSYVEHEKLEEQNIENIKQQQQMRNVRYQAIDKAQFTPQLPTKPIKPVVGERSSLLSSFHKGLFGRVTRQRNKLTVQAIIEQSSRQDADKDDDEEAETATLTPFVVPKEKIDKSPSYAQLKKTLPAIYKTNEHIPVDDDIERLSANLQELELTPTPILHSISIEADNMEVLSDTNSEDTDDDDPDDIVDDPKQHLKHAHTMDYLYALRKRMQNTTTPTLLNSNKFLQRQLIQQQQELQHNDEKHDLNTQTFINNNGLMHNHHFNHNHNNNNHLQERVVPKNAYFHALPTKIQNNNNHHNNNVNEQNHNQIMNMSMQQNRSQSVLSYANLPNSPSPSLRQDPRLAQRLGLPTNHTNNNLYLPMGNGHALTAHNNNNNMNGNYLSPVNSNSGSSIASSTPDYERALRHAGISRQPLQAYMPRTQQDTNFGIYNMDRSARNFSTINNNHNNIYPNNNNYMLHTLEPASSQLIYSANTVALGLADETNEVAENEANSAYPLVSSLV